MQRKQVRAAKQTNSRWISESENLEVRRWEHFAVVSLLCEILFIRWLCQVQTNGDWRLDQWLNADKLPFRDSQIAPMAKERFKQFFYSCQSSKTMLAPLLTSKTNDVGHSFFFFLCELNYPTWLLISPSSLEDWQTPNLLWAMEILQLLQLKNKWVPIHLKNL